MALSARGAYALVPARGGSKGLPGKNLRPLAGHPLIAWSIAAALASDAIERVICSTDSEEIAATARAYGAETPFMRPAELAADMSTDFEVFDHALHWLNNHGEAPDLLVQLRPTCPFRDPAWIGESVEKMRADPTISCIRSVTPAEHTPYKMWRLEERSAKLKPLLEMPGIAEPYNMPRQKLPVVYRHTGQLDIIRGDIILSGSMTGPGISPLMVDGASGIDIDGLLDFRMAELVFEEMMPPAVRNAIKPH